MMRGHGRAKEENIHTKQCRRCKAYFETTAKRGKVCDNCNKRLKNQKRKR